MSNAVTHMMIRAHRSLQNDIAVGEQNVTNLTRELEKAKQGLDHSRRALGEIREHAQRNGIDLDATP